MILRLDLDLDNMYASGKLFNMDDGQLLLRSNITTEGKEDDIYMILREGQTLNHLAWVAYKDKVENPSRYWWVIADANNIQNPLDLSSFVGTELLVPNIDKILLEL